MLFHVYKSSHFSVRSSAARHLSCFHVLAKLNNATVNTECSDFFEVQKKSADFKSCWDLAWPWYFTESLTVTHGEAVRNQLQWRPEKLRDRAKVTSGAMSEPGLAPGSPMKHWLQERLSGHYSNHLNHDPLHTRLSSRGEWDWGLHFLEAEDRRETSFRLWETVLEYLGLLSVAESTLYLASHTFLSWQ